MSGFFYVLALGGRPVYAGATKNIRQRIDAHSQNFVFDSYWYQASDIYLELEKDVIEALRPPLNKVQTFRRPPASDVSDNCKSHKIIIRIEADLLHAMRRLAAESGITVSALVRSLMHDGIEEARRG